MRRNGIGTALLQQLESNLSARGVRSVLLETAIDNEAAVAFWQRHGYRIEATLKRYYLGRVDAYEMRKLLLPPASKTHRSEEHTSELQSRSDLVCRLLLEKKKNITSY